MTTPTVDPPRVARESEVGTEAPHHRRRRAIPVGAAVTIGLVAVGFGSMVGSSGGTASAAVDRSVRTITGTSTGTASGVPDTATISLGADSRAASATAALQTNAQRVDGITKAMLFVGVKEADIQTSNISLFPTFDTRGHITGYNVSTRVTAKTHDVPGAGKVIDAAAQLAGDDLRVDTIALSIEDTGPVVRTARAKAVTAAHDQATQLARAAGVRLGRVRSIVEERDTNPSIAGFAALDQSAARAAVPVSPGTQDLQIRVKVVHEIA